MDIVVVYYVLWSFKQVQCNISNGESEKALSAIAYRSR